MAIQPVTGSFRHFGPSPNSPNSASWPSLPHIHWLPRWYSHWHVPRWNSRFFRRSQCDESTRCSRNLWQLAWWIWKKLGQQIQSKNTVWKKGPETETWQNPKSSHTTGSNWNKTIQDQHRQKSTVGFLSCSVSPSVSNSKNFSPKSSWVQGTERQGQIRELFGAAVAVGAMLALVAAKAVCAWSRWAKMGQGTVRFAKDTPGGDFLRKWSKTENLSCVLNLIRVSGYSQASLATFFNFLAGTKHCKTIRIKDHTTFLFQAIQVAQWTPPNCNRSNVYV